MREVEGPVPPGPVASRRAWRRLLRSRRGVAGLAAVLVLGAVGLLAPALANEHPLVCRFEGRLYFPALVEVLQKIPLAGRWIRKDRPFRLADFDFREAFTPARGDWALWPPVRFGPLEQIAAPLAPPGREHWLGTDSLGRDVLARILHGATISMQVGLISIGIAATLGVSIGTIAGYCGGWTDAVLSRLMEVVMCFPTLFLVLAVLAWLPPRLENVMVVIGLTHWVGIARLTRGELLRLREEEYALAARALGAGPLRIAFRHLLPNALAPALVSITFGVAAAILVEAGLSWLGLGVQSPDPSWGSILREGYDHVLTAPHLVLPPCVAISVAVLGFNLVGDALRDALDPRLTPAHRR